MFWKYISLYSILNFFVFSIKNRINIGYYAKLDSTQINISQILLSGCFYIIYSWIFFCDDELQDLIFILKTKSFINVGFNSFPILETK